MKIRNGFVSNSSAVSFCIYGWNQSQLKIDYDKMYEFYNYLQKYVPEIIESTNASDELVVGVGRFESDIDHYCKDNEDWHDYKCKPPKKKDVKKLDLVVAWLNLPAPTIHAATFRDG